MNGGTGEGTRNGGNWGEERRGGYAASQTVILQSKTGWQACIPHPSHQQLDAMFFFSSASLTPTHLQLNAMFFSSSSSASLTLVHLHALAGMHQGPHLQGWKKYGKYSINERFSHNGVWRKFAVHFPEPATGMYRLSTFHRLSHNLIQPLRAPQYHSHPL